MGEWGSGLSDKFDKEGCFLTALTTAVVILLIDMGIDLWANRRDYNYIRDLQQRVAILEQRR